MLYKAAVSTQELRQRTPHFDMSVDINSPIADLGNGEYQVNDISGSISVGKMEFVDVNGDGIMQPKQVGVWKSKRPNGNTVVKEYSSEATGSYTETVFNVDGTRSVHSMVDQGLAWRKEYKANGELVKDSQFVGVATEYAQNSDLADKGFAQKIKTALKNAF